MKERSKQVKRKKKNNKKIVITLDFHRFASKGLNMKK